MKALILAAGIGSRLRPETDTKPKCLVTIKGDITILDTQIESVLESGIKEIVIIIGYRGQKIKEHINNKYKNMDIRFVENNEYKTTNNMFSFLLAHDELYNQEFISLNADVAIDKKVIQKIVNDGENKSIIAIDKSVYYEESMKIRKEKDIIIEISKTISKDTHFATSIDVYKFNKEASKLIFDTASRLLMENQNNWFEVALNETLAHHNYSYVDVSGLKWFEIDNLNDLKMAEELFI